MTGLLLGAFSSAIGCVALNPRSSHSVSPSPQPAEPAAFASLTSATIRSAEPRIGKMYISSEENPGHDRLMPTLGSGPKDSASRRRDDAERKRDVFSTSKSKTLVE